MPPTKMRISTRLQQMLKSGSDTLKYDAWACRVLGEPVIIATLVKAYVPEFRDCTLKEIISLMVGTIDLEAQTDLPDAGSEEFTETDSDSVASLGDVWLASSSDTDKSATEGSVAFDVKVHIRLPRTEQLFQVIINIEAQKSSPSWKRLFKRQQYNVARMVSSQHERGFRAPEYERIVPVYSIWVMLEPSEMMMNRLIRLNYSEHPEDVKSRLISAAEESINAAFSSPAENLGNLEAQVRTNVRKTIEDVYGSGVSTITQADADEPYSRSIAAEKRFRRKHKVESMLNGVFIWLGPPAEAEDKGMKCLDVLFDRSLDAAEKGDILENEFGIPKSEILERQIEEMGALSAAIKLEGQREGRLEGQREGRLEGRREGRLEGQREGRLEGRREGRLEGRREGRLEGQREGRLEGQREGAFRMARRLLRAGFSGEDAVKETQLDWPELTDEEIRDAVSKAREDLSDRGQN